MSKALSLFFLFLYVAHLHAQSTFGGQTEKGYTYNFEADSLEGSVYGPNGLTIRVPPASKDVCGKKFREGLEKKEKITVDMYKKSLYEFYACHLKCLSYKDFLFENQCVDWNATVKNLNSGAAESDRIPNCTQPDLYQGYLEKKYDGLVKADDGSCKKRFLSTGESKMKPMDFYIMVDNSGSMDAQIQHIMNRTLPKVVDKIQSNYGDSQITLFTQNFGQGDSALTIYPGSTDVVSSVNNFRSKYSNVGDPDEKPLTALKAILEKGKMGRPEVENVLVIISDENSEADLAGSIAKDYIKRHLGKNVSIITTLPRGANQGIDELVKSYKESRNGLTVDQIESTLSEEIKKNENTEPQKGLKIAGPIVLKVPPEYAHIRSVTINDKELSPDYYEVRGSQLLIYKKQEPGKKLDIKVVYEYEPVREDPLLQKDKIINWYIEKWISDFTSKPLKEIDVLTMKDSAQFDHLLSYILKLKDPSVVKPFFGVVKKLDKDSLRLVFRISESRQKLVNLLIKNISTFKNKKEFQKILGYLKRLIATDVKKDCKGTGNSFVPDDYSRIEDPDEKRLLDDLAEMIRNYELTYVMKCAAGLNKVNTSPAAEDCE